MDHLSISPSAFKAHIGKRVQILPTPPIESVRTGIVRFSGTTAFAEGAWVGVELDHPEYHGKNSGSVQGVDYFKVSVPGQGIFVRPELVQLVMVVEQHEASSFSKATTTTRRRMEDEGGDDGTSSSSTTMVVIELQSEIDALRGKLAASEKKTAELITAAEALEIDVEIAKEEKLIVEDELGMLKKRIELSGGVGDSAKESNDHHDGVALLVSEATVERIQSLERRVTSQDETNARLKARVTELTQQLEDMEESSSGGDAALLQSVMESKLDLEHQLGTQNAACTKLRKDLAEFESLAQMQAEELAMQQREAAEYERAQEARAKSFAAALRESQAAAHTLRAKVAALQNEIASLSKSDQEKEELLSVSRAVVAAAQTSAAQVQAVRDAARTAQRTCVARWQRTVSDFTQLLLQQRNKNKKDDVNNDDDCGDQHCPKPLAEALGSTVRSISRFHLAAAASETLMTTSRQYYYDAVPTSAAAETAALLLFAAFEIGLVMVNNNDENGGGAKHDDASLLSQQMQFVFDVMDRSKSSVVVTKEEEEEATAPAVVGMILDYSNSAAGAHSRRALCSTSTAGTSSSSSSSPSDAAPTDKKDGNEDGKTTCHDYHVPWHSCVAIFECTRVLTRACGSVANDMLRLFQNKTDNMLGKSSSSSSLNDGDSPLKDFITACGDACFPEVAASSSSSSSSLLVGGGGGDGSADQQFPNYLLLDKETLVELCHCAHSVFCVLDLLMNQSATLRGVLSDNEAGFADSASVRHVASFLAKMERDTSPSSSSAPFSSVVSDLLEEGLGQPRLLNGINTSLLVSVIRGSASTLQRIWQQHRQQQTTTATEQVRTNLKTQFAVHLRSSSSTADGGDGVVVDDAQKKMMATLADEIAELRRENAALKLARERDVVVARELETERALHDKAKQTLKAKERGFAEAIKVLELRLSAAKAELRTATETIAAGGAGMMKGVKSSSHQTKSAVASFLSPSASSSSGAAVSTAGGDITAQQEQLLRDHIPDGIERERFIRALALLSVGGTATTATGSMSAAASNMHSLRLLAESVDSLPSRWREANEKARDWLTESDKKMHDECSF